MVEVFIILGDRNKGKSSVIRALSGVGRAKAVEIATFNGAFKTHVELQSLQESGILPVNFIAKIHAAKHKRVLVALWLKGKNPQLPSGQSYIEQFVHAGWRISEIAILGVGNAPLNLPKNVPSPMFFPNSLISPVNSTASSVRAQWKWY